MALIIGALLLAGCGGGDDDLTLEEQLSKLAGHPLSVSEVDETLALADTMCGFDTKVLTEIWSRLDARQLEFQDYVFGQHCPDRLTVYETARLTTGAVPEDVTDPDPDDVTDQVATENDAPEEVSDDVSGDLLPSDLLESITSDDDQTTSTAGTATTSAPTTSSTQRATTASTTTTRRSTTGG